LTIVIRRALMQKLAGIPTGAYQLLRIATPLDPDPKGPVYDGGILVFDGRPEWGVSSQSSRLADAASGATIDPVRPEATTPDELRNKYLFIDVRREQVALLTIPERHSRGDLLIECNQVRSNRGLLPPLSQDTLCRLMEDKRFRDPVLSATDIRVCGLVLGSAGLGKVAMDRFLSMRRVRLPSIEDLVAACAIHYATTGRHLIPLGRTVRAVDGVIRTSRTGGQIRVILDDWDEFARDPFLVAAGVVLPGQQSVIPKRHGTILRRIQRLAGLSVS